MTSKAPPPEPRPLAARPRPTEAKPGWCPGCNARILKGQIGRSAGRIVAYCTVCETYWVFSRAGARRASVVERRLARRDLFARHGLAEPVAGA